MSKPTIAQQQAAAIASAADRSLYIGIDPDINKSGVAAWDGKKLIALENLGFCELVKWLCANRLKIREIRLEGGWLNKSNWHTTAKMSTAKVAAMGRDVGRNHQTGVLIGEMIEGLQIAPLQIVAPLSKNWWAENKNELFEKTTGWESRSNPETRDAAMLVFGK